MRNPLFKALLVFGLALLAATHSQASILGAYYVTEQLKLNMLGYTQNIIPFQMPTGEMCRISYYHHRSSTGAQRHLLIHGFLDRSLTWRHTIEKIPVNSPLRKNLILVDLPHHGDSVCASVKSFDTAEAFMISGINAIRAKENFDVDGMWTGSLGGIFGLALLNTFPDAQLTMVVPPLLAQPYAEAKTKEISNLSTREALANFLVKVPPPNQSLPLLDTVVTGLLPRAETARTLVQNINAEHLWQGYLKSSKKIRILVSEDDMLLPIDQMDPRFTKDQKSEFQVMKGCGHSILRFCSDRSTPFLLQEDVSKISRVL